MKSIVLCAVRWMGLAFLGVSLAGTHTATADVSVSAQGVQQLIDALVIKRCAEDDRYRSIAGVACDDLSGSRSGRTGETDPDAVLEQLGATTRKEALELSLEAQRDDLLCAKGAIADAAAGGFAVGPRTGEELLEHFKNAALENIGTGALGPGLVLSIPGVTQVQYFYKGLSNGPEVRTFKIKGRLQGKVDDAKLQLEMDGDFEGGSTDLPIEYMVNFRTSRNSFPAWPPFQDRPGELQPTFKRQDLVTISPVATFTEKGHQRNGVRAWHDYEYTWTAEKIGALPPDILKQEGSEPIVGRYPYAGDWVGVGWSAETRFKQTGRAFVSQFSRRAAAAMPAESSADSLIMALNVKHQTFFYLHIDNEGTVSGRGVITYTLDPNLCGLATLTRQVNERINLMKYLPLVYLAAGTVAKIAAQRWKKTWTTVPSKISNKIDEYIKRLPPKIEAQAGLAEVSKIRSTHSVRAKKNIAFADVDVAAHADTRLIASSGKHQYPGMVPVPSNPRFKSNWFTEFRPGDGGWTDAGGVLHWTRSGDAETKLLEYLARTLPRDASGTVRLFSERAVCAACTGVIEQFWMAFPKVTLIVTSGS